MGRAAKARVLEHHGIDRYLDDLFAMLTRFGAN
jgi:hypothetical protein